jgi:hypothetical protein
VTVFLHADRATARARLVVLLPAACLTILVLAPWVFAYQTFKGKLHINPVLILFQDSIDRWWVRLFPLPLDVRTLRQDPDLVSTPHLDAQIGWPLILLAGAIMWKLVRARPPRRDLVWAALPVLGGMFFLWMSLDVRPYKLLPTAFKFVQFPYRMVTDVNLSALVALLLVCRLAARAGPAAAWGAYSAAFRAGFLSVLLTLAGTGVVVKVVHVNQRAGHWEVDYADLVGTFYGRDDYATPSEYPLVEPEEAPGVTPVRLEVERHAGRYTPAAVELEKPGFVGTQVQPFPWNKFYLDGGRVPDSELRAWPGWPFPATDPYRLHRATGPFMAVPVPAGRHILEHRFEPDRTWLILYWASLATTLLWTLLVIALRLRQTNPIPSA